MAQAKTATRPQARHRARPGACSTQMALIRRFEEKAAEMYALGQDRRLPPPLSSARRRWRSARSPRCVPTTTRCPRTASTATACAKGMRPARVMAELFGRSDGLCKGRAARCTSSTRASTSSAATAIVGAHLPLATGAALRVKYQGGDQVGPVLLRRRRGAGGRVPRVASTWPRSGSCR